MEVAEVTNLHKKSSQQIENWKKIGTPPLQLEWLASGITFKINNYIPYFHFGNVNLSPKDSIDWNVLKSHYLSTGAICIV